MRAAHDCAYSVIYIMAKSARPPRLIVDSDGIRIVHARSRWKAVFIAGLIAVAIAAIVMWVGLRARPPDPSPLAASALHQKHSARKPMAAGKETAARPVLNVTALPRGGSHLPGTEGESSSSSELTKERPEGRSESGAPPPESVDADVPPPPPYSDYGWDGPTGIGLFVPGTNPPKPGIIVPEDYELPPGYMRYYQATDDGHALAPILIFNDDYEFFDENGDPIEIPEDRVVPPEMVPPGLAAVEILEIPEVEYGKGSPTGEQLERIVREHPELLSGELSDEEIEDFLREHPELFNESPSDRRGAETPRAAEEAEENVEITAPAAAFSDKSLVE